MPSVIRALLAVTMAGAVAVVPATPAAATGTIRLEAENATLGGTCGDGQAQNVHEETTGETVVFLGGSNCYITLVAAAETSMVDLRWHGGGTITDVCGYFRVTQANVDRARTARTCSLGLLHGFQVATFQPGLALSPGPYRVYWHPESSWHDAHLDWLRATGDATRTEAEAGSYGGVCGDNQQQYSHTTGTGETVVFNGGTGCTISFTATAAMWVLGVRWYGGGRNAEICGRFAVVSGTYELARTYRSCSTGGASPDDFQVATFPGQHVAPGATYGLVWYPEGSFDDAHVDWIETTAGAPGSPGVTVSPASIDFGLRGSGSPSPVTTVTVTSTNPAPLFVSFVNTTHEYFDVMSDTCSGTYVWQDLTCTVGVRFLPGPAGDYAASLSIWTNAGLRSVAMTGSAESGLPWSFFTTPGNATLIRTLDTVRGTSHDERAGVDQIRMYYRNVANQLTTVDAPVTCSDAGRLDCTWSVPLPSTPGLYQANARARDRVGHWENPGPTIVIKVV